MKRFAILLAATIALPFGVAPARAAGVDELPMEVADRLFDPARLDAHLPAGPGAYRGWKSKKAPPWTFAYVGSTRFGAWSDAALAKARDDLAPKWAALGLSANFMSPPAAANDAEASKQIRELADKGADAILVCCASAAGINEAIKYAHDKGALTLPLFGFSTSPYAINVTTNFTLEGQELVDHMADELDRKGNVLVVSGFLSGEASQALSHGIKLGFERHANLKLVGEIAPEPGAEGAKAAIAAWLKKHHDPIDGLIVRSGADVEVSKAFVDAQRKVPVMTIGSDLAALCYWRHNLDAAHRALVTWPPAEEAGAAWTVAMRTLQGQGPKTQSILIDASTLSNYTVKNRLPENCAPDDPGWYPVGDDVWGGQQTLDDFFLRPADPTHYKP